MLVRFTTQFSSVVTTLFSSGSILPEAVAVGFFHESISKQRTSENLRNHSLPPLSNPPFSVSEDGMLDGAIPIEEDSRERDCS